MNNILKSCIVLLGISLVCVGALAFVNEITLEPIAYQEQLAIDKAYNKIFPGAEEYKSEEITFPEDSIITNVTSVINGGNADGYIVQVAPKGYGGAINMMVGIKTDGSIAKIEILTHSETPGLGANCEKDVFTNEFIGKSNFPLEVVKGGAAGDNQIDAITSSTITTKAVTDGVNSVHEWFEEYKGEGGVQ